MMSFIFAPWDNCGCRRNRFGVAHLPHLFAPGYPSAFLHCASPSAWLQDSPGGNGAGTWMLSTHRGMAWLWDSPITWLCLSFPITRSYSLRGVLQAHGDTNPTWRRRTDKSHGILWVRFTSPCSQLNNPTLAGTNEHGVQWESLNLLTGKGHHGPLIPSLPPHPDAERHSYCTRKAVTQR